MTEATTHPVARIVQYPQRYSRFFRSQVSYNSVLLWQNLRVIGPEDPPYFDLFFFFFLHRLEYHCECCDGRFCACSSCKIPSNYQLSLICTNKYDITVNHTCFFPKIFTEIITLVSVDAGHFRLLKSYTLNTKNL